MSTKIVTVPNGMTFSRVILSVLLLFMDYRSKAFVVMFLLCGLTDVLDGVIARRMKLESVFGARLDSAADFMMTVMITVTLFRQQQLTKPVLICAGAIFVLKIAVAAIARRKFGKAVSLHTVANKLTGLLLFCCPLAYPFAGHALLYVTGAAAALAAVEEGAILLRAKSLDLNTKSLFVRR